jgi:prefoldin subunit 5
MSTAEIQQKINEYSSFVEKVLGPDLQQAEESRNVIQKDIQEYQELQQRLTAMQKMEVQPPTQLDSVVDLGYNTLHCRAVVANTQTLFVHVGMGFHSELTVPEALVFLKKRIDFLSKQVLSGRQEKVHQVQAHVESAVSILRELQRELGRIDDNDDD